MQISHFDYWTIVGIMPSVKDLVELDNILDHTKAEVPSSTLISHLRRIIRSALSVQLDGRRPDAAALLFHQINCGITKRLLKEVRRISHTVAGAIVDCRANMCMSAEFVDFLVKAIECGSVFIEQWNKDAVAIVFHRIGYLHPQKHAAFISMGLPTNHNNSQSFKSVLPIVMDMWKVHHAPGECNMHCLDETIANLLVFPDLDEWMKSIQLVDDVTVLNNLLLASMVMHTTHQHVIPAVVDVVPGIVPILM